MPASYGMAGFVRVAPAPALVAGGGLAFAESALDHAELKIPNVALTPGRIPRQRHHPGLQSQHSVTTGATPPSTSRTTTSPRATEVTLAVASGTESRIGSPAALMAVRHLERGILHSCGPTLPAPPWRRLSSRCPEVAAPAHIDVMRRAVAAPRDSPAGLRVTWKHPPGQYRVVLGRTPPSACGSSQAASRPVGAMETLTEALRIASGCIPRAHGPESRRRSVCGRWAISTRCVSSVLADPRDWRWPARSPCSSKPAAGPMWPLFPPPGQRAPEFFTEQNGGRPMTRAMEQGMDAPARSFCSGRTLCSAGGSARRNKPKTPTTRNPMCSARPNAKLDSSDDSAAIDHAVIPANARPRPARMSWPRLRIHSATSSSSAPKISRMSWPTFRAHAFSLRVTNRATNIRVVLFGATLEALDPLPRQARHRRSATAPRPGM